MRRPDMALGAVLLAAVLPAPSGFAWAQTCTCAQGGSSGAMSGGSAVTILSDEAPPPLPVYDQPAIPSPGYIWSPGYWSWNNYEYYWVPGTWVEPPQAGLLWTPGYWAFADGVYGYHRGYWASHVGYYGGVDYGYGYTGAGYAGGYWNGDRLYYNRTVNNFGSVRIENVYEKPAPRNSNGDRMSFNGPGGVSAKPTAQDEEYAKEKRLPATKGQIDHARTASTTTSLFVSSNHGKPAIAATAKPAAFTGPGVVPAREGGVAPLHRANEPSGAEPNKATPTPEPGRTPEVHGKPAPGEPGKGVTPSPEPSRTPETHGKDNSGEPQKRVEPRPELHKTPAAGEMTEPKLPPKVEEQRREPHPSNEPQKRVAPEPQREQAPAGAERKPEERRPAAEPEKRVAPGPAKVERPNPPPAAQGARPPAPAHPQGAEHKCGEAGEPKCP